MSALIELDIGICVVPKALAAPYVAAGRLSYVNCRKPLPRIDFCITCPLEPLNEMAKVVADLMSKIARRL